MQITSRFTIAIHIICYIDCYQHQEKITSSVLSLSIGANPVIIRSVMSKLKDAGIILSGQGKTGISLGKELKSISFFDIYKAVECVDESGIFHFHENPNFKCPVGRYIHQALDSKLQSVQDSFEQKLMEITLDTVSGSLKDEFKKAKLKI